MLPILTPDKIKNARTCSIVPEGPLKDSDYILSGTIDEVNPSGNWRACINEYILQRNNHMDPCDCVTCSALRQIHVLAKYKYNIDFNKSRRYTAKKSGTIPGQGNSVTNVVESIRKDGCVDESAYPSMTDDMTINEFYAPILSSIDVLENFRQFWGYTHAWTKDNAPGTITAALKMSPVIVSVYGRYQFDSNGYVARDNSGMITHEVVIVDAEPGKFWYVWDSENADGLVPFAWDYNFVSPKIAYLTNLNLMTVYKVAGEPALYFLNPRDQKLVPFADGTIAGGDLFKTFFGSYANMHIQTKNSVAELPFAIADYSITTK